MPANRQIQSSAHPTSQMVLGYMAHDIDKANDTKYYGMVNNMGGWYIIQEITSAGTFRYTVGKSNYSTGWTGRAALTYNYWNLVV